MRKALVVIALLSALLPIRNAHALEDYIRCGEYVSNQDYKDQYQTGQTHAFLFEQALLRKDWNAEERKSLNFKNWVDSRHGTLSLTSSALTLIGMQSAKIDGRAFDVEAENFQCLMGQFAIYSEQPWSGVHSGFVDHLSPEMRSYYWSLPEQ